METPIPPIFIFMLGIAVQIVFACFIYAVFMAWNFLFVDPVDDSLEIHSTLFASILRHRG